MYSNITMIIPISLIFIVPALYTMWYMTTIELSYRIVSGLDKLGFCSYNVASGTRTLWADEVLWEPEWATLSREEPKRLCQSEPEWPWQSTPEIEPEWVRVTETDWAWDRARVNQREQERARVSQREPEWARESQREPEWARGSQIEPQCKPESHLGGRL